MISLYQLFYKSILTFSLALIIVFLYKTVYQTIKTYIIFKKQYGEKILVKFFPLLGIGYYMMASYKRTGDCYDFYKKIMNEQPHIRGVLFLTGFSSLFVVLDNEWVKYLTQDFDKFEKGDFFFGQEYFSEGSLFYKNTWWKRIRTFLNGNFHFEVLKNKVEIMKQQIQKFAPQLEYSKEFTKLDTHKENQKVTSEVVVHSFFGRTFSGMMVNDKEMCIEIIKLVDDLFIYEKMSPYFQIKLFLFGSQKGSKILNTSTEKKLLKRIENVFKSIENVIDERINQIEEEYSNDITKFEPKNQFMDLYIKEYLLQKLYPEKTALLEKNDRITKIEMITNFAAFFIAGLDSTAILVSYVLFELTRNPSILEKLKKEIKTNIPIFDNLQHEDLKKLEYLDMIIKETLRLYPATQFSVARVSPKTYVREDLYIPAGMQTCFKFITYSEKIFEDVFKFNPDRYYSQEKVNIYDNIPFSAGPRNCIGQHFALIEAKIFICYILQNFEIKEVPDYELKMFQKSVIMPDDQENILIRRIKQGTD